MKLIIVLIGLCAIHHHANAASLANTREINSQRLQELIESGVDQDYLQSYGWLSNKFNDVLDKIKGTYSDFSDWAGRELADIKDKVMPHVEAQVLLAKKFMQTVLKSGSEAAIKAGYEYFKENKSEIGLALWQAIEDLYRKHIEDRLESYGVAIEISDEHMKELVEMGVDEDYIQSYGWLKTKFNDVIENIKNTYSDFKDWAQHEFGDLKEQIMPHVDAQILLAKKFLKTIAKSGSEAAIKAGYEYFKENQNEIGLDLWKKVEELYREKIEKHLEYVY